MEFNGTTAAILLGVWATFALDTYSAFCSSPQTTEININKREESLMYWVAWGCGFAIGGGAIASVLAKSPWPIVGAGSVALVFWRLYKHAGDRGKTRALESETEDY